MGRGTKTSFNRVFRENQKPVGSGPIWLVGYRRVSNTEVDIISVHPHGTEVAPTDGVRHILVRGQDELAAMQNAIKDLDWLGCVTRP